MMFIACNVPKFLEEQMNKMKDALTGGMNEDNLKGFEYAVDTMLSILRQTIHAARWMMRFLCIAIKSLMRMN